MLLPIEYEKLNHDNCIFIDVRSPIEFNAATIDGAINLALFTDEEREIIGTLYKHQSPTSAKKQGVEIVSKKLPLLYETILGLKQKTDKRLVLFCARGGSRSTSLALLLNGLGENIYYIKDGYRGYRRHILSQIPILSNQKKYIVLHGRTGVGKTKILHQLKQLGHDICDLESLACHRGSLLGGVGLKAQPSTKTFESRIYHNLKNNKSKYVFIEAESRRIGKLFVPECIKSDMAKGIHIFLDATLDFRADILTMDYTESNSTDFHNELNLSLDKIRKYMGNEPINNLQQILSTKDYHKVAKILMKDYYDPMYDHSINKYKFDYSIFVKNIEQASKDISNYISNLSQSTFN